MHLLPIVFALRLVYAGTVSRGGNCSIASNHLDTATHKFLTDCDDITFCTAQKTCQPKQCRRDEFPFGYPKGAVLPPLCPQGQFCPDEGSACSPLLALGQACQMNRDDQCAPPPIWTAEAPHPMDVNPQSFMRADPDKIAADVSICLHFTCMYANATLATPCITDTTVYAGLGPQGAQFSTAVVRDNCLRPGLFCSAGMCVQALELGQSCQRDQECRSYNCNVRNVCANPPTTPLSVPAWQYILTVVAIFIAMSLTCLVLTLVHKRHRKMRHMEALEYYREQLGYRRSIIALHSVAASRASSVYERQKGVPFGSASRVNSYGGCSEGELSEMRGKRRK